MQLHTERVTWALLTFAPLALALLVLSVYLLNDKRTNPARRTYLFLASAFAVTVATPMVMLLSR